MTLPVNAMAVTFADNDKLQWEANRSNVDLQKFNSAAPTLNNTPIPSRSSSPSPAGKKLAERSPTPSPRKEDIEAMEGRDTIRTVTTYSNDELNVSWMGAVIVACFFTSGLTDAVAFNSWACFVNMQSGNTVFAALGLGGLPYNVHGQQFVKSLVAIGSFCFGTIFFNILHRSPTGFHNQPSSRRRIIFVLSFLIQTILTIAAASLVMSGLVSNQPSVVGEFSSGSHTQDFEEGYQNYKDLVAIVLLSFQAAGQVCLSRVLGLIELPTIVVSTLYHDWTADLLCTRHLWRQSSSIKDFIFGQGRRQNKRLASIVALFLGGVVGGEMYKSQVGMAGALWLAAGMKGAIAITFALWKKQRRDDELEK